MTSSWLIPEASNLSTNATVMRIPRIVGCPMQTLGFTVIRSNNFLFILISLLSFKYFICDLSSQTCPRKNGDESSFNKNYWNQMNTDYQGIKKRSSSLNEWQVKVLWGIFYLASQSPPSPLHSSLLPHTSYLWLPSSAFPVSPFVLI